MVIDEADEKRLRNPEETDEDDFLAQVKPYLRI
jgi:hypothetical protein